MTLFIKVKIMRIIKKRIGTTDSITDVFFSSVDIFGKKVRSIHFFAVDKDAANVLSGANNAG